MYSTRHIIYYYVYDALYIKLHFTGMRKSVGREESREKNLRYQP